MTLYQGETFEYWIETERDTIKEAHALIRELIIKLADCQRAISNAEDYISELEYIRDNE